MPKVLMEYDAAGFVFDSCYDAVFSGLFSNLICSVPQRPGSSGLCLLRCMDP